MYVPIQLSPLSPATMVTTPRKNRKEAILCKASLMTVFKLQTSLTVNYNNLFTSSSASFKSHRITCVSYEITSYCAYRDGMHFNARRALNSPLVVIYNSFIHSPSRISIRDKAHTYVCLCQGTAHAHTQFTCTHHFRAHICMPISFYCQALQCTHPKPTFLPREKD